MERYWVAPTSDNFNSNNWATVSGGDPGASVPDSSAIVFFDRYSGSCLIDSTLTILSLNLNSDFSNSVTYTSAVYTNKLNLGGGYLITSDTSVSIYVSEDTSCLSGFGSFSSRNNANITLDGSGVQYITTGGIFPSLTTDKTTANPVLLVSSIGVQHPIFYVNGDVIINDGIFNTRGHNCVISGAPPNTVPPLPTSVYYITSSVAGKLLKSTDLTSFYLVNVELGTSTIIDCICKANGLYVASSYVGDLYSSTDGIIWSLRLLTSDPDPYILWRQIIWSTLLSKFVAIGDLGFGNYGAVALSSDGIVWNLFDTAFPEGQYKVLEFDGMLVSVGWKRTAYTSTDGVVWTQRMTNYSSYNSSVIHDALNSRLIAMPVDSPYFYTSADGLSWEQVATIDYPGLYNVDIAMVGNVYYVASYTGIKKSTNLSTWEDMDLGADPADYYMMSNFNFVNGDLYACGASYDEDRSLVFKLVDGEFMEIPSDGEQAGYMVPID